MTVLDLKTFREQKAQAERAPVMIERAADPHLANRTYYRLTSPSRDSIQSEIDYLTAQTQSFGHGLAMFLGPHPVEGGYRAVGIITVFPDA